MKSIMIERCLTTTLLDKYLNDHQKLLSHDLWDILERLWLFQLDRDGFLVTKEKLPPTFLGKLYQNEVSYVGMKDDSNLYYVVLKTYINENPDLAYTSQLRPDF